MRQHGEQAFYEAACSPRSCELFRYLALPNAQLWEWYDRLIGRQQADLRETVVDCMRMLDTPMIEAFVEYRRVILIGFAQDNPRG